MPMPWSRKRSGGSGGTTTPSSTTISGGCNHYIGDGFCDDINNNLDCTYDGGDCCGANVITQYCAECLCLDVGGGGSGGTNAPSRTTSSGGCNQYIGDGFCDDINNNLDCTYDGRDCCGANVNTQYCTECLCLDVGGGGGSGGTNAPSGTTTSCNQAWIADEYCDDINNNLDCTYDGGDCCGANANTQYCTACLCLEVGGGRGGTTTPSGTTASVGCNQGWIGDGYCHKINNNLPCIYDGGDCCLIVRISLANELLSAGLEFLSGNYEISIMLNGQTSWINGD